MLTDAQLSTYIEMNNIAVEYCTNVLLNGKHALRKMSKVMN